MTDGLHHPNSRTTITFFHWLNTYFSKSFIIDHKYLLGCITRLTGVFWCFPVLFVDSLVLITSVIRHFWTSLTLCNVHRIIILICRLRRNIVSSKLLTDVICCVLGFSRTRWRSWFTGKVTFTNKVLL